MWVRIPQAVQTRIRGAFEPVRRTPQPAFQVADAAALVRAEPVVAALAAIRVAAPGYE